MRMHAIDAPEMPGACRPGRQCTPGDPYAARDYLRRLTKGRDVKCEEKDVDAYGRMVVRCTADGRDLGCAMVEGGHAVERYGRLNCTGPRLAPAPVASLTPDVATAPAPTTRYVFREAPPARRLSGWWVLFVLVVLAGLNGLGFHLMRADKRLAFASLDQLRRTPRLPDAALLALAGAGGGVGMVAAHLALGHKLDQPVFSRTLILLAGVQIGLVGGLLLFWGL